MLIDSVFNQKVYPQAGDVDDCWVVATIQAMHAVAPWNRLPNVTWFRGAAGDPDDGDSDGGQLSEMVRGARRMWPDLPVTNVDKWAWDRFKAELKNGRPAATNVVSGKLPTKLRFGFAGLHTVVFFHEPGVGFFCANPLAPDKSRPLSILPSDIRTAAEAFGGGAVVAALFPTKAVASASRLQYTQPELDAAVASALTQCNAVNADLQEKLTAAQNQIALIKEEVKTQAINLIASL